MRFQGTNCAAAALLIVAVAAPAAEPSPLFDGLGNHGRKVVTTSPALDAVVIAGVFAVAMTAGALVFDYRERTL